MFPDEPFFLFFGLWVALLAKTLRIIFLRKAAKKTLKNFFD